MKGANIPHVEHVNHVVKSAIYNQVSNLSPTAITIAEPVDVLEYYTMYVNSLIK